MKTFTYADYKNLLKKVKIANSRIQRIEKRYGESSWAVNELYSKIDNSMIKGISPLSGNIKINKNMSDLELKAILKATESFLSSKTSTLRGIRKTTEEVKNSLQATFGDESHKITDEEISTLYNLVEDKNKREITEQIGASEVWAKTIQAKEQNLTYNEYEKLFMNDIDIKDKEIKDYLRDIYNKYKS